jgi:hypothetical protein
VRVARKPLGLLKEEKKFTAGVLGNPTMRSISVFFESARDVTIFFHFAQFEGNLFCCGPTFNSRYIAHGSIKNFHKLFEVSYTKNSETIRRNQCEDCFSFCPIRRKFFAVVHIQFLLHRTWLYKKSSQTIRGLLGKESSQTIRRNQCEDFFFILPK